MTNIFHYPSQSVLRWYRVHGKEGRELLTGYYWYVPQMGRLNGPFGPYESWYAAEAAMKQKGQE